MIILDDCSTDDSRDIINQYKIQYPEILSYFNDKNTGSPFAQWNKGVSIAKGEFIWIAESDDSASSDFLEKTVQVLKKYKNAGLVFTDSKILNEHKGSEYLASQRSTTFSNEKLGKYFNKDGETGKSLRPFVENPIVNVSSILFRKSKYLEAGGTNPSMKYCGDWMLYIKMFLISDIKYLRDPLNVFKLHSDSSYHSHYRSDIFLKEKMRIFSVIIKNRWFSPIMIFLLLKKAIKAVALRLIFYFRADALLKIELPRQPRLMTR